MIRRGQTIPVLHDTKPVTPGKVADVRALSVVVRLPDGTVTELSTVHQGALDGSGYRLPTPRI